MIFDTSLTFESEKERNLYYKFFAGFFLNELVDGYASRTIAFRQLINRKLSDSGSGYKLRNEEGPLRASFDYHSYLLEQSSDRGELADILIEDTANNSIIAIEAKFLTDWSFRKDVLANADRIGILREKYRKDVVQALLLTRRKNKAAKNASNHPGSNFQRLSDSSRATPQAFIVLEWEELIDLVDAEKHPGVSDYFSALVAKNREDFRR